jgi:para-aminobenzoate synthetase/4-amino-4-deoxychorismate lyase
VLLAETHAQPSARRGLLFTNPIRLIVTHEARDVVPCLEELDRELSCGRHVAGFLAYEAACGLHPKLDRAAASGGAPLVWFGVFGAPRELDSPQLDAELKSRAGSDAPRVTRVRFDTTPRAYAQSFEQIQYHLTAGDSYQVCHSIRCHFELEQGSPAALFELLSRRQRTAYSALIETGERAILSLSPELFFKRRGDRIELKPMKGTAPRGRSESEDEALALELASSPKTRAENVMIVDLLRNDIGRVARIGSVCVPALFAVERYETLLQMTSTITATLLADIGLRELLQALFPCGSIVGAPKLRTMQIIADLEPAPRDVFCGSIGYATPAGDACFNVAIRTASIDRAGAGTLGVGGGVVVDSSCESEYAECLLKAEFLLAAARSSSG